MTDSKTVTPPVKRVLKPVPDRSDRGIHVHSSKTNCNDQFALPGSAPEPGKYLVGCPVHASRIGSLAYMPWPEIIRINTMAVPQPFLEPDKLEQWK
ncbi:hypothetical protein V8C44DRAFT_331283 [Trichoderma aethiopicum]